MHVIIITEEMIKKAKELEAIVRVNRTKTSEIDTLTGILGEFVFAQFFYDDWRLNRVGFNKGEVDFDDIEIKTSSYPFNSNLNLVVREDYARKRKPKYYVQIIISVEDSKATEIPPGTSSILCGYATSDEIDKAEKKDFGSKNGGKGGYKCLFIPISKLHNIDELKERNL